MVERLRAVISTTSRSLSNLSSIPVNSNSPPISCRQGLGGKPVTLSIRLFLGFHLNVGLPYVLFRQTIQFNKSQLSKKTDKADRKAYNRHDTRRGRGRSRGRFEDHPVCVSQLLSEEARQILRESQEDD